MRSRWTITAVRGGLCIWLVALGGPALAVIRTHWQHDPAEPGDWFEPANWSNGVPNGAVDAYINNGGEARISASGAEAWQLCLGDLDGDSGTVRLTGTGQLSAKSESIGDRGTGTFIQTGGSNTADYLSVNRAGHYQLSGGWLTVTDSAEVLGTLDFAGGSAAAAMGGVVNFADASLTGAGSASFTLSPDSLLVVPPEFDPASEFGTFTNQGCPILQRGSSVTIPPDKGFTGTGTVEGHIACQGTINPISAKGINVEGGLNVSRSGIVNLGPGTLTVDDGLSGISDQGRLSAEYEHVGRYGTGKFSQTSGTNTVNGSVHLGYKSSGQGTYELSGTGQLSGGLEYVGYYGTGTFAQSGGTNTVSGSVYLGYGSHGQGTYELSGTGQLSARGECVGYEGTGTFAQTGGTNTVSKGIYLGLESWGQGTYELSDSGCVSAEVECIGYSGQGTFTHTGGTNTVTKGVYLGYESSGQGTYELSGNGQLSVDEEYVGRSGRGTFIQTGGSNATDCLWVNGASRYEISGGTLTVTENVEVLGTLDFAGGDASVTVGGLVNLAEALLAGAGSTSFTLNSNSLLIVPPRFDPTAEFGTFTNHGSIVHQLGSTVVIPAGQGFAGAGTIEHHIVCHGTISAVSGRGINLNGGLNVSGNGNADLGLGTLAVDDIMSGVSDTGQLAAKSQYIGQSGTGTFTHTGGTNRVGNDLCLGCDSSGHGTYELSGTGQASAAYEYIGGYGNGTFIQSGGTNAVTGEVYLGFHSDSEGRYQLSGTGEIFAGTEYIGYRSKGTFTQTGGTNTVGLVMYLGCEFGGGGTYELSATGRLFAEQECIGHFGPGRFIQTGGTNTVGYLSVNGASRYDLYGGTLSVTDSAEVLGTLDFADGTAAATMGGLLDLADASLTGGGSASFTLRPDSLLILPLEFDPARAFGDFTNHGSLVHYPGSTLIIAPGKTVTGSGAIDDHVACEGTMKASSGKAIVLKSGLELSGNGNVDLGSGALTVKDTLSGLGGAAQLAATKEDIGRSGTGTFTQTGGTNTIRDEIYLGYDSSGHGSYALSGTGQLSAGVECVGCSGTGTFTQTGGTNTVRGNIYLGYGSSGYGSYVLSGTGQLSSRFDYVGRSGRGSFTQTGGTHRVSDHLSIGHRFGSEGTYELSGTGQLSVGWEYIGGSGMGKFTQTGGTNTVKSALEVATGDRANATYELTGSGQLSAEWEYIGGSGMGEFTQTGGTNTINDSLTLGFRSGSSGTYLISAGQLATRVLYVGREGSGTMNVTGAEAEISVSRLLSFGPLGSLAAVPGSTIHMTGAALENKSTDADSLAGLANLVLVFEGGTEETAPFEVAGRDLGPLMAGFEGNFALGALQLGGADAGAVQLVDNYDNQPDWEGSEALYAWNLEIGPGSRLDLGGLNLYYVHGAIDPAATILGGTPTLVPEPSTLMLLVLGMMLIVCIRRRR